MSIYKQRVFTLAADVLSGVGPFTRALDFGSGDGWYARRFREAGLASDVVAVDVVARRESIVVPILYDGRQLPFPDRSFDLVYSMDVLHHCNSPRESLAELLRCADRYVLIKDHTYRGGVERLALAVLDEIGNRRLGIPSPYHYQHRWEWSAHLEEAGFVRERLVYPAPCFRGLLGWAINRLQYVSLWKRRSGAPPS